MPSIEPELIILNGKLICIDEGNTIAQAAAITNGRFTAIGADQEIVTLAGPSTRIINLRGYVVVPGFNDAHCHPTDYDPNFLDLSSALSISEIQALISKATERIKNGHWLVGGGWHENLLHEKRQLTRWDLDSVSSKIPVVLFRQGYHALVANSQALNLAGVDDETKLVTVGRIERRLSDGKVTGLFWEPGAMDLIWDNIPESPITQRVVEMKDELRRLTSLGLTSLTSSKLRPNEMRVYQHLYHSHPNSLPHLKMEPWAHWRGSADNLIREIRDQYIYSPFGDHDLRLGALKLFVDGDESAGTALMYTSEDNSYYEGLLTISPDDLNSVVLAAHSQGWQVAIHAIGDAAVDISLNAIENAMNAEPRDDPRHAIIHGSFCTQRAIERMAKLGVVVIPQPNFIFLEGDKISTYVGEERSKRFLRLRTILDCGVHVAFSSDNLPFGPLLGVSCAAARETQGGQIINIDQAISVDEALRCYTIGGAYTSFEEKVKGSLKPGYLADMVVLSDDPFNISPSMIAGIKVLLTIVNGHIAYKSDLFSIDLND